MSNPLDDRIVETTARVIESTDNVVTSIRERLAVCDHFDPEAVQMIESLLSLTESNKRLFGQVAMQNVRYSEMLDRYDKILSKITGK